MTKVTASTVAELQGLYGPFSFPEKLLQKIWLRGDFDRDAATALDGRRVRVIAPGKWNLLGGPDFRGARLRWGDGPEITGDVELHLHATDWAAHAHARDPAYDGVVLHVVLFPPEPGQRTRGAGDREIPVLVLLPLLLHDLEEFAADEAVETLAGRATALRVPEELVALGPDELTALLHAQAAMRWRQKVHFARLRLRRLGWDAACHHAALEILGYRFNRGPMLRVAARSPLAAWKEGRVDVDHAVAAEHGAWSLQGVRPANRPRVRLRQYAGWVRAEPDWTQQLAALGARLPQASAEATTGLARRVHRIAGLRQQFGRLCGGAVGGTRLDNLVCDGFLPLLAARTEGAPEISGLWFHWYPGDLPPGLGRSLRALGVVDRRAVPMNHGLAQGLLGWLLEHDARR